MTVASSSEGGGVTTVHLKTLGEGKSYYLNGRASDTAEGVAIDKKRCKIRCPVWNPTDTQGLLAWLTASPNVIMAGMTPQGEVFGLVRVANGTEDQQEEASKRWAEQFGRQFPHESGCTSWNPVSLEIGVLVKIGSIHHTNWRAEALRTDLYERYQRRGEYGAPLKIERRGTATASERAKAYADSVPLDEEGTRNQNLAGAMFNIAEKFGHAALEAVTPGMLERSTLPEKEKRKVSRRILNKSAKGELNHGNE